MITWRATGILLSARKLGEANALIEVFTEEHGRHAGVVRGGASRKRAADLQPGAQLDVTWQARIDAHVGSFTAEPVRSRAAAALGSRLALAGVGAVTALLRFCLAERDPHPRLYRRTEVLLDRLGEDDDWPRAYLAWELLLLDEMGFGLDLSACAVTGATEGLDYVSPRSGRAVTARGAGDWADRLLPLPAVLLTGTGDKAEVQAALRTTGYFMTEKLAHQIANAPLPDARARLVDAIGRT